jgi:uncharacterized membrane protein
MTLPRPLFYFGVAAIALVATTSASFAQFNVCNRTSASEIYVALGLYREEKGWESEGWFTIPRNECTLLLSEISDRYYYLYAESGDSDTVWEGADEDGGTNFCVRPERVFTLNVASLSDGGDNPECEKHGYVTKKFMRVDTEKYSEYNFDIND